MLAVALITVVVINNVQIETEPTDEGYEVIDMQEPIIVQFPMRGGGRLPKYLVFGIPISDYYGWGQEIYAPCDGVVVRV